MPDDIGLNRNNNSKQFDGSTGGRHCRMMFAHLIADAPEIGIGTGQFGHDVGIVRRLQRNDSPLSAKAVSILSRSV